MPLPTSIEAFLLRVARRQALVRTVRDAGLLLGGLALMLLVLVLTADLLPPNRTTAVAAGTLVALSVLATAARLWLLRRGLRDRRRVAQLVGARFGALRSDLLSVVELGDELGSDRPPRFSAAMYHALVEQVRRRLGRVSPRAVSPGRHLRPAAVLLSTAAVTWAFVATLAPERLSHGASNLLAPGSADATDVAARPLVGDLKLTYIYPAYIGRRQRTIDSSTGHISAPLGTRVKIEARALAPLIRASTVILATGKTRPKRRRQLTPGEGRRLAGELTVEGDGHYYFEVQTIDGRVVRDPVRHRIDIEPDAHPRATLHGHPDGTEVTARQRVEVGFSAEDDHGLREVRLAYRVSGRPPASRRIWQPPKSGSRARAGGKTEWDLATLDLRPGTRLAYWIEALDSDTVSGPKRGVSPTAFLTVFSPENRKRRILALQTEVVEQALRVLADRLVLFGAGEPLEPRLHLERARVAHRAQAHLVDQVRELRNRMRGNKLFPDAVFRAVGAMRKRLGALTRVEAKQLREIGATAQRGPVREGHLARLRGHNAKAVSELERDSLLLADLLHEQQLQSLVGASRRLLEARERLTKLIARYRKAKDKRLRDEIMREIRYMQDQLRQLVARMARLQRTIPDEYLNAEAIKGVQLGKSLQRLSTALGSGNLKMMERALASLDRDLGQLQALLGGNVDGYRSGRMRERERAFGQLLDRLRDLEAEQRRMVRRTDRLVESYRRKAAKVLRDRVAPLIARQQARLRRLQRALDELDRRPLASYQREQVARIKKRLGGLRSMLKQRDVDQALSMASRVHNGLRTLRDDLIEDIEAHYGSGRSRLRRALRHTRKARGIAAEIERELESVFPEPRSLLTPQDRQRLAGLKRDQQKLRRSAEQLAKDLLKRPDGSVGLPRGPRGLRDATRLMQRATGKLGAVKPQEARSDQLEAAERLASLQRQLRRSRQPRATPRATQRGRVKIPGAEAFSPPREFRQDILEAMKEPPPRRYKRQVKRYYEELVR